MVGIFYFIVFSFGVLPVFFWFSSEKETFFRRTPEEVSKETRRIVGEGWSKLDISGQIWTNKDNSGQNWTLADKGGHFYFLFCFHWPFDYI